MHFIVLNEEKTEEFLFSEVCKSKRAYSNLIDADYLRCLALVYCKSDRPTIKGFMLACMIANHRCITTKEIISKMCRLTSTDMYALGSIVSK